MFFSSSNFHVKLSQYKRVTSLMLYKLYNINSRLKCHFLSSKLQVQRSCFVFCNFHVIFNAKCPRHLFNIIYIKNHQISNHFWKKLCFEILYFTISCSSVEKVKQKQTKFSFVIVIWKFSRDLLACSMFDSECYFKFLFLIKLITF